LRYLFAGNLKGVSESIRKDKTVKSVPKKVVCLVILNPRQKYSKQGLV